MPTLTLSDKERATLERWARRPKTAQALARRAEVVLGAAAGKSNTVLAGQLRWTNQTVGRWRARFLERRLDGLLEEPSPWAPRQIGDDAVERVLALTLESAPRDSETIDDAVPQDPELHLILDNYATHKTPAIRRWLLRRPRFHLHFTPTSAPWINLVERWFAALTDKQIRRGTHRSTRELERAIRSYLAIHNEHPKPFVWTKTADQILASLARFVTRISDSGH